MIVWHLPVQLNTPCLTFAYGGRLKAPKPKGPLSSQSLVCVLWATETHAYTNVTKPIFLFSAA